MTLTPLTVSVISHVPHELVIVNAMAYEAIPKEVLATTTVAVTQMATTSPAVVAVLKKNEVVIPPKVPAQKLALVEPQKPTASLSTTAATPISIPFFSQFYDISAAKWKKVGCGVTSLAMIIDYYKPGEVTVNSLLTEGILAGAYESNAGWIHQGLIDLAVKHGLTGAAHDLSSSDMSTAFSALTAAVQKGPVIASVHYTFHAENPIPHLVVVSGIKDGMVYFNDPAAKSGGGSISIDTFKSAWKKQFIGVRGSAV